MKETVTIEIAGATYRLVSEDGEHLEHLASLVNNRIDALGSKGRSTSQKLALVALSLIDDLESTRAICEQLRSDARSVALDAMERIDRRLEVEVTDATKQPAS